MRNTTPHIDTLTVAGEFCSVAQGKNSFCGHGQQTLFSFGEDSLMPALTSERASGKRASTARSFVMKDRTAAATLFAKRAQLLIAAGLICGITPTSIRKRYRAAIQGGALFVQGGESAAEPKVDC